MQNIPPASLWQKFEPEKTEPEAAAAEKKTGTKSQLPPEFSFTPMEVKAHLDRFVIKQDEAKKALAIAICDHYHHIHRLQGDDRPKYYLKQNILLLGPTGVGKSYLIKQIAKYIGVPFVRADATRFSETGYMGANVDDVIRDLVQQADGDISKAEQGIVYIDEIDKLATSREHRGRDVSGRGVQTGLLKLMEDAEVDLNAGNDIAAQMQAMLQMHRRGKPEKQVVKTENILFIMSGAFEGIADIIKKRLGAHRAGFLRPMENINSDDSSRKLFLELSSEDLAHYGLEAEFIGRLPIRVACEELNEDDLYKILVSSEESIIQQYVDAFAAYGIACKFTSEALQRIASLACKQNTGARALMSTLEQKLRDFKFHLPSSNIKHFVVTAQTINEPERALQDLLNCNDASVLEGFFAKIPPGNVLQ